MKPMSEAKAEYLTELERDADSGSILDNCFVEPSLTAALQLKSGEHLDAAIDAAMAKEKK